MTPTREQAWELVEAHTKSETLRRHMRAVEAAMAAYAGRFGEDEEHWRVIGLIHDWDYERHPTLDRHPQAGIEELRQMGWPDDYLRDIASHADHLHVERDTNLRRSLYAVDEMTGFIIACALVKPDRSLGSVDARTVRKKMKDKAFARAVHREELVAGAEALGVPFDEHIEIVRDALVPIAPELGLNP
ncbi:MAG TPA: HDIG domain-containing protein [Candidatus Dormibacteraeota bacterium]